MPADARSDTRHERIQPAVGEKSDYSAEQGRLTVSAVPSTIEQPAVAEPRDGAAQLLVLGCYVLAAVAMTGRLWLDPAGRMQLGDRAGRAAGREPDVEKRDVPSGRAPPEPCGHATKMQNGWPARSAKT
jgi:hypothetical protein